MHPSTYRSDASAELPLSDDDLTALQESCGPVGLLQFPPVAIIRKLRQYGYVSIVLGGVQITPAGLERLLRERERARLAASGHQLTVPG